MSSFTVTVTWEDNLWVAVATNPDGTTLGALDFTDFSEVQKTMPGFIADMAETDSALPTISWRYEINGKEVTEEIQRLLTVEGPAPPGAAGAGARPQERRRGSDPTRPEPHS